MPPPSSLVGRSTRAARGVRGDPEESEEPRLSFEELFELFRKKVEYSLENRCQSDGVHNQNSQGLKKDSNFMIMGDCGSKPVAPAVRESRAIDREHYNSTHPGLHNPPAGSVNSTVSTNIRAIHDAGPELLSIKKLDLKIRDNAVAHHTDEYDITDKLQNPNMEEFLVVRRGQSFEILLECNRPYKQGHDDLRILLTFGKKPMPTRGTHVEFMLSDKDDPGKWNALILSQQDNLLRLKIMTPPECAVGIWNFVFEVVKRDDKETVVYRHTPTSKIYILFNPWCKDDQVFMPETASLSEYVLNETGKIYSGSYKNISPKPWDYGQFTADVLDCCVYLLDNSNLPDHERGNPILVARKISAVVNAPDDNGVLVGNWSGNYGNGTSPLNWPGSVEILEEYWMTKSPVKYGQCWVFSGVVTTVCRALGIPCRSVTNFASAHDTDGSITIDYHFDSNGKYLDHLVTDSVWNFHVWNDTWMARPDLPKGFGGWQAIDATPQETSDGFYCLGPCALLAIRRGDVHYPYDGKFVFAEVNADKVYWMIGEDGSMEMMQVKQADVGKFISTKRAGKKLTWAEYSRGFDAEREDITRQYKFEEGSEEERAAVRTANQASARPGLYQGGPEDVRFELSTDDNTFIGDDIELMLKMTNTSDSLRTISGRLALDTNYYTGVFYRHVDYNAFRNLRIGPGMTEEIQLVAKQNDYLNKLADHCMLHILCMAGVVETKQNYTDIDDFRLRKPHLVIKAPEAARAGEKIRVEVSFDNPLTVPLTNCELKVEGHGLLMPTRYPHRNVDGKRKFVGGFDLTPAKRGQRDLIVYFNSDQISAITSSHQIMIN